ncbi:DUF2075 domain-containing protein [Bacillus paranthracis]|uniref:DNA/RNA helicase domain-containing protein n=1 Tax=Bacillus paranthracis TaxID=2026186 RepID=UPI0005CEB797|nr:DNA/RNA helicase domain-containing protein [Bacillus paranthracis]MDA1584176.1 DUF2075 domain-containing protein [Bacillus cereus group sp. TH230-1LC]QCU12409.1 DUF2075 domain-containing protein [Bacillus paranthracis]
MSYLLLDSIKNLSKLSGDELVIRMLHIDANHSRQEQLSWKNSLYQMIQQVHFAAMDHLWLVAEYSLIAERRIDLLLFGKSLNNKEPIALIVELKQWEKLKSNDESQKTYVNVDLKNKNEYRVHPVFQTVNYCNELKLHHEKVSSGEIKIKAIQYLHNFTQDKTVFFIDEYKDYYKFKNFLFVKGEEKQLQRFLKELFDPFESGKEIADSFVNSKYIMNEISFNGLKNVLDGKDNATMIEDQHEVSAQISTILREYKKNPSNHAIVIQGDAGTGKTIIGIHLLYLAQKLGFQRDELVLTFAKSKMLREVLKNEAELDFAFPYLDYIIAKNYSLIVVDEAHRMSNVKNTIRRLFLNDSRPKIVVFLQDDYQRVLPEEEGTKDRILSELQEAKTLSYSYKLTVQKRSGNQGDFVDRIHNLLYGRNKIKSKFNSASFFVDGDKSLNTIDSTLLSYKQKGQTVKWFAPYDWEWKSKNNISIQADIVIEEQSFQKQWNPMKNQYNWYKSVYDQAFNQVGSVYTAQGLDYDYTGFIWYDDLYWDNSTKSWKFNLDVMRDATFVNQARSYLKKNNANYKQAYQDILTIVLNQYYVLLTRARKGIYVWFKDSETQKRFLEIMKVDNLN